MSIILATLLVATTEPTYQFADLQAAINRGRVEITRSEPEPEPKPKVEAEPEPAVYKTRRVYNILPPRRNFSYPWTGSRYDWLVDHLMGRRGSPQHRGKFEEPKLRTLSLTSLERLHSNDHNREPFRTERVLVSDSEPVVISKPKTTVYKSRTYCPT